MCLFCAGTRSIQKVKRGFSDEFFLKMRNCFVDINRCADADIKAMLIRSKYRGRRLSTSVVMRTIEQHPTLRKQRFFSVDCRMMNEFSSQHLNAIPLEVDAQNDDQAKQEMSSEEKQPRKQIETTVAGQDIAISAIETISTDEDGMNDFNGFVFFFSSVYKYSNELAQQFE